MRKILIPTIVAAFTSMSSVNAAPDSVRRPEEIMCDIEKVADISIKKSDGSYYIFEDSQEVMKLDSFPETFNDLIQRWRDIFDRSGFTVEEDENLRALFEDKENFRDLFIELINSIERYNTSIPEIKAECSPLLSLYPISGKTLKI
tara:strand:+ start:1400 stop:1837 length:438 start_codon:yes stop_codon:yes gene_type:complete